MKLDRHNEITQPMYPEDDNDHGAADSASCSAPGKPAWRAVCDL
jgi:hypothetical protein